MKTLDVPLKDQQADESRFEQATAPYFQTGSNMASETKIERMLKSIEESENVDFGNATAGKLLIVAVQRTDGEGKPLTPGIAVYAWTETDIIRWHDAVVKKRYELERANGKEPTWGEAFAATEWPESRGSK